MIVLAGRNLAKMEAAKVELDELGVERHLCKTDIADRAQVQFIANPFQEGKGLLLPGRTTADTQAPASQKRTFSGNMVITNRAYHAAFTQINDVSQKRRIGNEHSGIAIQKILYDADVVCGAEIRFRRADRAQQVNISL